jgi:hypothetical protein
VKKGDTLGAIARANLPAGRLAEPDADRDLPREPGRLHPREREPGARRPHPEHPDRGGGRRHRCAEANKLVRSHMAEFREYRSRLAAVPAPADAAPGQREAPGTIEPKPEAPKPRRRTDQLRLSKADPQKPGAAAAARADDAAARERALQGSAIAREGPGEERGRPAEDAGAPNQQLAELEKKAGAKPAPTPAPAPSARAPRRPPSAAPQAGRRSAEARADAPPAAPRRLPRTDESLPQAPKAPEAPKPEAPKPEAAKPEAPKPAAPAPATPAPAKPAAKPAAPAPEPSLLDEFLDNPVALAGLGARGASAAGLRHLGVEKKKGRAG